MLATNYRTVEPSEPSEGTVPIFASTKMGLSLLPQGQVRVSRCAWGADYHEVIRGRLHKLADFHRRLTPSAQVRGVVDTAPLLEKQFAQLAGLGWIGKNTLLINQRFGSWMFLAALLTTEELVYDEPCMAGQCGSCRACLDACPSGTLETPFHLDARKCISYQTQTIENCDETIRDPGSSRHSPCAVRCSIIESDNSLNKTAAEVANASADGTRRCKDVGVAVQLPPQHSSVPATGIVCKQAVALGNRLYGCDACQEACPWNRDTPSTTESAFYPNPGMNPVDLAELLALDEETFRRRFRHTPLWRARRNGILRKMDK